MRIGILSQYYAPEPIPKPHESKLLNDLHITMNFLWRIKQTAEYRQNLVEEKLRNSKIAGRLLDCIQNAEGLFLAIFTGNKPFYCHGSINDFYCHERIS